MEKCNDFNLNQYMDSTDNLKDKILSEEKMFNEYKKGFQNWQLFDTLAERLKQDVPKRSIVLDDNYISQLFKIISCIGYTIYCEYIVYWNVGYNRTILPYIDLSKIKYIDKCLNLKNHKEIGTSSTINKENLLNFKNRLKGINLNGVNLANYTCEKIIDTACCDFRNTNILVKEISGVCSYLNFENENLENTYIRGRMNYCNFKNTGAKVSFFETGNGCYFNLPEQEALRLNCETYSESSYCDYTGCEITDLTEGNLERLRRMSIIPFEGTKIEYDNKIYEGTNEIHKLVKKITGDVLLGIHEKPKQKTIGSIK